MAHPAIDPNLKSLIKEAILPPTLPTWLGHILSVITVLGLIISGFNIGVGPLLSSLLDLYEAALRNIFGPVEPYIEQLVRYLFQLEITLHPHGRYIFVLLFLYFTSGALADLRASRRGTGSIRLVLGFALAGVFSIVTGTIPLTQANKWQNFAIAFLPYLGASINDVLLRIARAVLTLKYESQRLNNKPVPGRWEYIRIALLGISVRTIVGAVFAFGALQIPAVQRLESPGLALLVCLTAFLGLYQIYLGWGELNSLKGENESRLSAALRSRGILIGLRMLRVFVWACSILVGEYVADTYIWS